MGAGGVGKFVVLGEDLHGAVEAGDGFGELGADVHDLEDGRDHEGEEHGVLHVVAFGEASGESGVASEEHDEGADDSEDGGGGEGERAGGGERLHHVVEEALHTAGKDGGLALLGVVALDDTNSAE